MSSLVTRHKPSRASHFAFPFLASKFVFPSISPYCLFRPFSLSLRTLVTAMMYESVK